MSTSMIFTRRDEAKHPERHTTGPYLVTFNGASAEIEIDLDESRIMDMVRKAGKSVGRKATDGPVTVRLKIRGQQS